MVAIAPLSSFEGPLQLMHRTSGGWFNKGSREAFEMGLIGDGFAERGDTLYFPLSAAPHTWKVHLHEVGINQILVELLVNLTQVLLSITV